jgi:hypothetical protein
MDSSTIWRGSCTVGRLLIEVQRYILSGIIGKVGPFGLMSLLLLVDGVVFVALKATHTVG